MKCFELRMLYSSWLQCHVSGVHMLICEVRLSHGVAVCEQLLSLSQHSIVQPKAEVGRGALVEAGT
jgi:hypothetical protein